MKKKNNINIKFIKKIKLKKIILRIVYVIILICILYNVIFLLSTTISKKEYFSIFGISLFPVESNSMKDEINKNDLVIVKGKNTKEKELKVNDIIIYNRNGKIIISKIFNIKNVDGKSQYITKANNNYYPDNVPVFYEQIIGEVHKSIPFLGLIISILQSKITTLIFIILLILKFLYNTYIYKMKINRKKKKQQSSISY